MNLPRSFIKATIPILSVFLMLAGIIQLRAQMWATGTICITLAMAGLIVSVRLLEKTPFTSEDIELLRPWVAPALLWMIVLGLLTISVFHVADNLKSPETDRIAAVTWWGSVVLGLITIWGRRARLGAFQDFWERMKANRSELLILLIVIVLAFAVRTIGLTTHPYPWSGDEASIGTEAIRILNGGITNFFETGWSSQPNWSFVPTAITEFLFGRNILGVRMVSALAGTLAVLFVYLVGRDLFNPSIGLMAAAFLATLPYNVHFSRVGVNNVMDALLSALVFWLLARGIKKDDARYYYAAGVAAGLSIYTYAGTRLVLILAGFTLLFMILRQRIYLSVHWKHLIAFSVGALISAAPQAAFFVRHPDIFMGRFAQEGILLNGWLSQHAMQTGKSVWEILFNQFMRTTMVFIASPAPGNFFNSPIPYLTVLGSILFLLGMGYALAFGLETKHFILLLWFWAVILFGGILTLNPPANTRMLMTSPAVALFMALGAFKILDYLQRFKLMPGRLAGPVFAALVCIITYQNVRFYMVDYQREAYFQDANSEYAMEIGFMAKQRGRDLQLFILGAPRIFSGFPTLAFIAPDNPRADLDAETIDSFVLSETGEAGFFAVPENRSLLEKISEKYAGGERGLVYRKTKPDEILFEYYIVTR